MGKKICTLEYSSEEEAVELHINYSGAKELIAILKKLVENNEDDHYHLLTEDWGSGSLELSSEKQNLSKKYALINHLKLLYWTD